MRNECNIIRDILPLYLEGMVSDDTAEYVKEHLEACSGCSATFEALKGASEIDQAAAQDSEDRKETALALISIKRKLRRKTLLTVAITAVCLSAIIALLHYFPVYRIAKVWTPSYFHTGEISMLAYIGDREDRAIAQSIIGQAEAACSDLTHTYVENKEKYGPLSQFAVATDRGAVTERHSIELWSAHFTTSEGYMWVYYSQEAFDADGNTVCGSWDIPSLWRVEKNDGGKWVVTHIKEHP